MIDRYAGARMHPRRASPIEIRLVVMAVIVALLAVLPAVAGAQDVPGQPVRLSLGDAVDRAMRGSEAVDVAEAGLLRARGDRYQARSGFFPKVGGTVGYTRTLSSEFEALRGAPVDSGASGPFDGLGDLPFGQANRYDIGLQASQTVFAGGRIVARSRVAEAGVRSAQVGVASARAALELDVTEAYWGAVLSDRLVVIAEASLAQAEATLSQVRAAEGVGESAEFDVLRAQVARDNQRPQVIQRRADRELAHMRLKQLLNVPMDATLELTTVLPVSNLVAAAKGSAEGPDVEIDADTSSDMRAAVRQATELVTVREQLHRATRAERLPSIAMTSQWGRVAYPKQGVPAWDDMRSNWTVGVQLELPILTGGAQRGAELKAQADVVEARAQLEQTRELAALDARSALERLESAEAAWEASMGTVEQAERAYRIAEIRFREGLSTQVELSDARLMLQQAEMNRAVAARDVEVARTVIRLMPDLPLGR
ncbi:MAG TPA: TolC family protein [Longimicrobiales bacterium]|nr:TolC family protein [Longimicrobiales bacterium]